LVWKSAKLPGAGFRSWWPVVYGNAVIFPGSSNYRDNVRPGAPTLYNIDQLDREVVSNPPSASTSLRGRTLGPRGANGLINTSQSAAIGSGTSNISGYYEAKPWRRTYFVLNKNTGQEITFDFNGNGTPEYAPFLWLGTQSGNRYPPAVGSDGLIYQATNIYYDSWINGGVIAGWQFGTPYLSTPTASWHAIDEPTAYAIGGSIVYWNDSGNQRVSLTWANPPTCIENGLTGITAWTVCSPASRRPHILHNLAAPMVRMTTAAIRTLRFRIRAGCMFTGEMP
jgi:hypothetical protein